MAIPCAGDVPAHFLGTSPAKLDAARLVHSRAIGSGALIIVDTAAARAVRVDVHTGVLPKDPELTRLRGRVINKKRGADGHDHKRFFDRLGELICDYVRAGDENFHLHGPVPLDWSEHREKPSFAPGRRKEFRHHLVRQRISPALAGSLVGLGILAARRPGAAAAGGAGLAGGRGAHRPVLHNDGGRLEVLGLDEQKGELRVRFVGSCANCPYSLLSMEQASAEAAAAD